MIKLKFISAEEDIYFQKNIIYITFSKTTYLKNQESSNLVYFFDIKGLNKNLHMLQNHVQLNGIYLYLIFHIVLLNSS